MGGFNFIFCVAENFIKTVGFDFIVSNANDFIKNSESSTLSTKNIKTSFLYPTAKNHKSHKRFVDFYFVSALRSVSYDGSKSPISVYRYSKLLFPTNLKVFYYTFGELYLAEKRSKIIIDVRR